MNADPVCGASHTEPVFSENFKMGKDGSMEEALVYLKKVEYKTKLPVKFKKLVDYLENLKN